MKSVVPRGDILEVKLSPKEYVEKIYLENSVTTEEESLNRIENKKSSGEQKDLSDRIVCDLPEYNNQPVAHTKTYRQKHLSNLDYVSRSDPEAQIVGRPHHGVKLCYKEHFAIDKDSRVITAVCVTEGAKDDGDLFKELIERQPIKPKEVCGDSKYGTAENFHYALEHGILPSMSRWNRPPIRKSPNQWGQEKFQYDRENDCYICPAGNKIRKVAFWKNSQQWAYRSRVSECKRCGFKCQCLGPKSSQKNISRHIYQETLDRVAIYLKTPSAQESIKERKMYAEWAIAEAKTLHGLSRTRFRGKWKVSIQALLTASVQNIKRLVKYYESRLPVLAQHSRIFKERLLLNPLCIFKNFAFCLS